MEATWIVDVIWRDVAFWGEGRARCRTPAAARLMRRVVLLGPWPRPLGFWMEGRAIVALREEEGEWAVWECRVRWIMLDQGVREKPMSSRERRWPER